MTMEELYKKYPDPDDILNIELEKLAIVVLSILQEKEEVFCLHSCINEIPFEGERQYGEHGYPQARKYEIHLAVSEAFAFLRTQTLIVEKPENSGGIWMVLSRRARKTHVKSKRVDPIPDPIRRRPVKGKTKKGKAKKGKTKKGKTKKGKTNEPGNINENNQKVIEKTDMPGHANQKVHRMECLNCGHNYGANGYDCHLRKCPRCGGGQPGLPYE